MQGMSPEEIAQQTKTAQEQLKAQANYKVSGAEVRPASFCLVLPPLQACAAALHARS